MLISFAENPDKTRGRLYKNVSPEFAISPFLLDRDRLIRSNAFRRLDHKTQVIINPEGDHYRRRLTHTIEVASIAKIIARQLKICEDLTEVVALAHDLGHPPFGHEGEKVLDEIMQDYGGFNHNDYTLKLITNIECYCQEHSGLNLSWEVVEGVAKHNGPIKGNIPKYIAEYNNYHELFLHEYSSAEAQVAALADDITYNTHDIEDGIRAGIIEIDDFSNVLLVQEVLAKRGINKDKANNLTAPQLHEILSTIRDFFIMDIVTQTLLNVENLEIKSVQDCRKASEPLVSFSVVGKKYCDEIKAILFDKFYSHPEIKSINKQVAKVITSLYSAYTKNPSLMPKEWQEKFTIARKLDKAMIVADYIAGMTDRFALREYEKLK